MTKRTPYLPPVAKTEQQPDWAWIRIEYSEGVMPVLQIALAHGVSSSMILRRAKQERWTRVGAPNSDDRPLGGADTESKREARLEAALELDVERLTLQPEPPLHRGVDLDDL